MKKTTPFILLFALCGSYAFARTEYSADRFYSNFQEEESTNCLLRAGVMEDQMGNLDHTRPGWIEGALKLGGVWKAWCGFAVCEGGQTGYIESGNQEKIRGGVFTNPVVRATFTFQSELSASETIFMIASRKSDWTKDGRPNAWNVAGDSIGGASYRIPHYLCGFSSDEFFIAEWTYKYGAPYRTIASVPSPSYESTDQFKIVFATLGGSDQEQTPCNLYADLYINGEKVSHIEGQDLPWSNETGPEGHPDSTSWDNYAGDWSSRNNMSWGNDIRSPGWVVVRTGSKSNLGSERGIFLHVLEVTEGESYHKATRIFIR